MYVRTYARTDEQKDGHLNHFIMSPGDDLIRRTVAVGVGRLPALAAPRRYISGMSKRKCNFCFIFYELLRISDKVTNEDDPLTQKEKLVIHLFHIFHIEYMKDPPKPSAYYASIHEYLL